MSKSGKRLLAQSLATHLHEAQLNAGFFFFGSALPRRHECARVSGCVLVIGDRTLSERSCNKKGRLSDLFGFLSLTAFLLSIALQRHSSSIDAF